MKTIKETNWVADHIIVTKETAYISDGLHKHEIDYQDVIDMMKALPLKVCHREHVTGSWSETSMIPTYRSIEKLIIKAI